VIKSLRRPSAVLIFWMIFVFWFSSSLVFAQEVESETRLIKKGISSTSAGKSGENDTLTFQRQDGTSTFDFERTDREIKGVLTYFNAGATKFINTRFRWFRAYPNNPVARNVMMAHTKCNMAQ
jgi:hypothetical protein